MRTSNIERVRDENIKLREILLDCEKAVGNMDLSKTLVENIAALAESKSAESSPTIELLRRVEKYLEPYSCFTFLRKDVVDEINRLQSFGPAPDSTQNQARTNDAPSCSG